MRGRILLGLTVMKGNALSNSPAEKFCLVCTSVLCCSFELSSYKTLEASEFCNFNKARCKVCHSGFGYSVEITNISPFQPNASWRLMLKSSTILKSAIKYIQVSTSLLTIKSIVSLYHFVSVSRDFGICLNRKLRATMSCRNYNMDLRLRLLCWLTS